MWFIGVELEQETSAPPPKKNPGSAPAFIEQISRSPLLERRPAQHKLLKHVTEDCPSLYRFLYHVLLRLMYHIQWINKSNNMIN